MYCLVAKSFDAVTMNCIFDVPVLDEFVKESFFDDNIEIRRDTDDNTDFIKNYTSLHEKTKS